MFSMFHNRLSITLVYLMMTTHSLIRRKSNNQSMWFHKIPSHQWCLYLHSKFIRCIIFIFRGQTFLKSILLIHDLTLTKLLWLECNHPHQAILYLILIFHIHLNMVIRTFHKDRSFNKFLLNISCHYFHRLTKYLLHKSLHKYTPLKMKLNLKEIIFWNKKLLKLS